MANYEVYDKEQRVYYTLCDDDNNMRVRIMDLKNSEERLQRMVQGAYKHTSFQDALTGFYDDPYINYGYLGYALVYIKVAEVIEKCKSGDPRYELRDASSLLAIADHCGMTPAEIVKAVIDGLPDDALEDLDITWR